MPRRPRRPHHLHAPPPRRIVLPWPLPAVLVWAAAWLLFAGLRGSVAPLAALGLACAVGVAGSLLAQGWWRRGLIALGFPLSAALGGAVALPAWGWLLPLALLLLVYPLNAWRDAPLFPTPSGALHGLQDAAPLPAGAAVLDAGCGLGDGLKACARPIRRRGCTAWSGADLWRCCAGCAAPGRACGAETSGPQTGAVTTLCTCSSGPRAWPVWPRRPARRWRRAAGS